jgi:hypothetical protein
MVEQMLKTIKIMLSLRKIDDSYEVHLPLVYSFYKVNLIKSNNLYSCPISDQS